MRRLTTIEEMSKEPGAIWTERLPTIIRLSNWRSTIARAYQNRGFVKALKADYEGAVADYDRAIQLDRKNAVTYAIRAVANASKGNPRRGN